MVGLTSLASMPVSVILSLRRGLLIQNVREIPKDSPKSKSRGQIICGQLEAIKEGSAVKPSGQPRNAGKQETCFRNDHVFVSCAS